MKKNLTMKRHGKVSRIIAVGLSLILTAGIVTGCGEKVSDEELIREAITEELDSIKNLEDETLEEMGVEDLAEQLEPMGVDGEEFMKTYLDGFDYTVGDIKVDGEKATASITLKIKSFNSINTEMQNVSADMLGSADELAEMSEDELMVKMGEVIMGIIEKTELKETEPIEISYELKDKVWTATTESEQNITNAMLSI